MSTEREVLVAVLKTTKEGRTSIETISRAHVPIQIVLDFLRKYSDMGFLQVEGRSIVVTGEQRLRVAVRAIELGADIERVCRLLSWDEFEDISIIAFESNGFTVKKHFRFKWNGRRWEIDILGLKEPIITSVDCKHWHRGWSRSAITKVSERQIERTKALTEVLAISDERISLRGWSSAYFVPLILSLVPSVFKLYKGVPIVSVLQLGDFLQKISAHIYDVTYFHKSFAT